MTNHGNPPPKAPNFQWQQLNRKSQESIARSPVGAENRDQTQREQQYKQWEREARPQRKTERRTTILIENSPTTPRMLIDVFRNDFEKVSYEKRNRTDGESIPSTEFATWEYAILTFDNSHEIGDLEIVDYETIVTNDGANSSCEHRVLRRVARTSRFSLTDEQGETIIVDAVTTIKYSSDSVKTRHPDEMTPETQPGKPIARKDLPNEISVNADALIMVALNALGAVGWEHYETTTKDRLNYEGDDTVWVSSKFRLRRSRKAS